jgi:ATP-dependent RNA helicase DDX52/ROK1
MDLLKILSRGTKKSTSKTNTPAPVAKPPNPQLYHDPTRRIKRKREDEALQPSTKHEEEDVDFFASKDTNNSAPVAIQDVKVPSSIAQTPDRPQLDPDEVRQVLRSHRLKFTLLSKHEGEKLKVKKSKKKVETVKSKAKDGKRPLFPRPLTTFNDLRSTYKISARLVENLGQQGYRLPTEVQLGCLPLLLDPKIALDGAAEDGLDFPTDNGINLLAVAPTGSGKTLAFLVPTINAIMRRRAGNGGLNHHALEAIVLAPTRELAHQIENEGRKLAAGTGVKVVGFKKGMRLEAEGLDIDDDSDAGDEEMSNGSEDEPGDGDTSSGPTTKADILVTTPMLLLNFLTKKSRTKRTLPYVRSLVLDEGDVLLDVLFRDQVLGIWSSCTHESLRLTCWSATMASNIEAILIEQLASRDPETPTAPLIRLVVGLKDSAVPSIDHRLIYTGDNEQGKLYTLRQLLHPNSSNNSIPEMRLPFLVFVQTIERASSLHEELKFEFPIEAGGSTRIATLHSSLSDTARSSIIARFRAGEIWVLITTDLLMRGIDFRGVNGVVNFDVPTSAAAYVHRVGRTGRAGHEGGIAVTFYSKEDVPYLKSIANVISLSEKQAGKASDEAVPKWLMDALPKVRKEDKKKLKERGVESRRGHKAQITSKSAWERKRENNRQGAIAGSKKRKIEDQGLESEEGRDSEWGGIDD